MDYSQLQALDDSMSRNGSEKLSLVHTLSSEKAKGKIVPVLDFVTLG